MRLEQFTSSVVDVYYPSQFKEMSHFIDEDWISSSEVSCVCSPRLLSEWDRPRHSRTSAHDHLQAPYADYTYTPATSLPFTSPETSSDSVFIRPRNSPLYGHHVQDLIFPGMVPTTTQGLGIETHTGTPLLPSNLSSPTSESMPATSFDHGRRMSTPVPILPKPGLRPTRDLKRTRDESEGGGVSSKRRKRSTSFQRTVDLTEEERLLVELKDDQNLPWKEIAQKFEASFGRQYQVPQLQMRFKRLRERMRTWTEEDVSRPALHYSCSDLTPSRLKHFEKPTNTGRRISLR
jgi:hypothetical protein